MEEKFLRWFKRHHKMIRLLWTMGAYLSIYALFYDALAGAYLLQIALALWFCSFVVPGSVVLSHAICNVADSRGL
ncbi:MAG: hypothetical protein IJZ39_02695 [Oscillospiraceae bacterium]|nr:hypothetical protein [Oscillospiraceae bacterium]